MAAEFARMLERSPDGIELFNRKDFFASILWSKEDIKNVLNEDGYARTQENVELILNDLDVKDMESCENGWAVISDAIRRNCECLEPRRTGLTFEMHSVIRFNRPVTLDDMICPGGFEMTLNGKDVRFDFENYMGSIDDNDSCIVHTVHARPDYDSYAELLDINEDDLRNISEISEFVVYTGATNDKTDLKAVGIETIKFVLRDKNERIIEVDDAIVKTAVICDGK